MQAVIVSKQPKQLDEGQIVCHPRSVQEISNVIDLAMQLGLTRIYYLVDDVLLLDEINNQHTNIVWQIGA